MRNLAWLFLIWGGIIGGAWGQENPVTNGSFEAVDPAGRPMDWEILGQGEIVAQAHSGQKALLLTRPAETSGETGLNRRWKIGSGEQGAMLAQLTGGLEFYYQVPHLAPEARILIGVIPMDKTPIEGTGAPRTMYEVPRSHIGDGRWHRGRIRYDYTNNPRVKWIHVSARIVGGPGQLLLDDIRWLPTVGPLLQIKKLTMAETPGKEGEEAILTAHIANIGDQPLQMGNITISTPQGLSLLGQQGEPASPQGHWPLTAIQPQQEVLKQWRLVGLREKPGTLFVRASAGEDEAEAFLEWHMRLETEPFVERFVLAPGEKTTIRLIVRNEGNTIVKGLAAQLTPGAASAQGELFKAIRILRPGQKDAVSWKASLAKPGTARLELKLTDGQALVAHKTVELYCARMPQFPALSGKAYVQIRDKGAVIGNQRLRLVLALNEHKAAGPAWLQVAQSGKWQTVGVLPRLASIALSPASRGSDIQPLQLRADKAIVNSVRAALRLAGAAQLEFSVTADSDTIDYQLEMRAPKKPLYGLHGPLLYVGEGSWGAQKTEAIFPGLEWLTGEEESSSTLDIADTMSQRWRWSPPPHAITIPCMSVHHRGLTVGLMWDHLQRLSDKDTRPRALFAAPDHFEGRNACLLGLMAPGGLDPEYWLPSRMATEKPWAVPPGQPIRLHAQLYAQAGTENALSALDYWFTRYGVPSPQRLPHGLNWQDEISFSARGYLEALWDPETQKWFAYLNGPNQHETLGWHASYLYDVVQAAQLASAAAIRQACAERAALVEKLSGQKPVAEDLGFEYGNPISGLQGTANRIASLIRSQGEDGSWRFRARIETQGIFAGKDYGEIGPDQAAEVGTCAANAFQVLLFARMTGDPQAIEAGLKALRFMDQFTVPRAAQVWEVPVHTPDVLASADACEAYLEGYLLTGDKKYLRKAVYWARTGLPFLYMWDVPGYEVLRYASIPVFGASWFTCSWFGVPVQWNGLRLARAYTKLAEHDKTYPWRRIAEGLTISAMWQQHGKQVGGQDIWPDTNEKWIALWPDNFDSISLRRCPWLFAPRQILDLVYRFMGLHPNPETVAIGPLGQQICLNACAAISNAGLTGDTLAATFQMTPPQTSRIVICNVSPPRTVLINGQALAEKDNLLQDTEPGWKYFPSYKALLIQPGAVRTIQLELQGVRYSQGRFGAPVATQINFSFEADEEGWQAAHDLSEPVVRDGVLTMTVTGPDPYVVRSNMDVPAEKAPVVIIRMAVSPQCTGGLQVFWTTADSPNYEEAKSLRTSLIADGQMHEYRLPMSSHPMWAGKRITGFRLDPGGGPPGVSVKIDYVRGASE